MKRKTRFNEGGLNPYQGDDVDPFSAVRDEKTGGIDKDTGMSEKEDWEQKSQSTSAPKQKSFKEAFAAAKDGSNFEWNGKMYKKEYAQKRDSKAEMPKPATESGRGAVSESKASINTTPKTKQSIYDTSRDPLIRKVKEAFREPTKTEREAKNEMLRESRRGQQNRADTYYGKKAEDRMKDMRGYKSGGSASSRADGCAMRGKTRGKVY